MTLLAYAVKTLPSGAPASSPHAPQSDNTRHESLNRRLRP